MNVIPNYVSDEQLAGARVVVMGLGRFGGGVGVTRFLVGRGANVLVTDMADAATLQTPLNALSDLKIDYRLGSHDVADLDGADLLVVSPAVDRTKSAFVQAALNRGIAWTTEIGMFIERCPGRILQMQAWTDTGIDCGAHRVQIVVCRGASPGRRKLVKGVIVRD